MNELVFIKSNDIFTDSLVIAEGTGNKHDSITRLLRNYSSDFEEFGNILFTDFKSINKVETRGRKQKIYLLNEMQATLLMTYLDNNEIIRNFKKELVQQFFKMRQLLFEKSTQQWISTRQQGKLTRNTETDTIKKLVEYAKAQGSEHADKLYITYSKLANKIAGVQGRDIASVTQLNNLSLIENIILHVIDTGIKTEKHYKAIYQDCKARLETFKDIAYLAS